MPHGGVPWTNLRTFAIYAVLGKNAAFRRPVAVALLSRSAAVEDAIGVHPHVRLCAQTPFLDVPLSIDESGSAQHSTLVH